MTMISRVDIARALVISWVTILYSQSAAAFTTNPSTSAAKLISSPKSPNSISHPFSFFPNQNHNNHHIRGPASSSPLFVASSQNDDSSLPVIKSIDAQMEKTKKMQAKYEEKLSQYTTELALLEQQKKQYLDGMEMGKAPPGGNFSETALRSGVKAICWRIIAGTVTLITSLKFSGSLSTALQIVSSDFFSKAATMFIGERVMNKSQAGRGGGADNAGRSLAKALIWRLFAICNTLSVSFFISGDVKMASKIAGSDAIFKTALMFFYERVWAKIEWGKEYNVEFFI